MLELWFDGSCWPLNPGGHCGAGVYIKDRHEVLYEHSEYVGHGKLMSCNVAEYAALNIGLSFLLFNGFRDEYISCRGDSKLVIKQMCGMWRAKNGLYLERFKEALRLKKYFRNIEFIWVPRENNCMADLLSTACLAPCGWKPRLIDVMEIKHGIRNRNAVG